MVQVRRVAAIEGAEREAMMTDLLVVQAYGALRVRRVSCVMQEEASTQLAYERQQGTAARAARCSPLVLLSSAVCHC